MAKEPRLSWGGNRQAQAEADAAWNVVSKKRLAKSAAKKQRSKFRKFIGNKRPKWLRADGSVDYYAYIKSGAWRRRRERWFAKFGRKCGVCTSTQNVQLHHKTYERLGREADGDLEAKCGGCHSNHHESDGKATDPMTREFLSLDL